MAKLLHGAFTSSASVPLLRRRDHISCSRYGRISLPFHSESSIDSYSTGRLSTSVCCSDSSWKPWRWISTPLPVIKRESRGGFEVKATSVPDSADENDAAAVVKSKMAETAVLGLLFALWYLFNIYFSIYNKQVLEVFPNPLTITADQLAVGTAIIFLTWASNLHKWPNISRAQLVAILPLAVMHTLGNLSTNMSLGKVSVSFTHTIKALEPFFTVILSTRFLGAIPTPLVVASLVPIVGEVALASLTDVSLSWNSVLNHNTYVFLLVYACCITCERSQIHPCLPAICWAKSQTCVH